MGLSNWLRATLNKLSGVLRRQPAEQKSAAHPHYSLLARFIFQASHCRKEAPAKAKPGAFLPKPLTLKISALWRDALPEQEIWSIGDSLGSARGKQPIARADFDIAVVSEALLSVEPEPHPRHVNLCGWPTAKDEQKAIALLLCARSALRMRGNSDGNQ
jgi:hypothetical protein